MRKTKRFAPLVSGLLIIIFLSLRYNNQLLIEQIIGDGMVVIGVIVILYSLAIYAIIKGIFFLTDEFHQWLERVHNFFHSGFRKFNDV
jgi:hypothetical protein